MSAPATASSTGSPAAGTARSGHAAGHRAGASNATGGADVFSNLLDLLSAASGESLLDPLATGGNDTQPGLGAPTGKRGRHTKAGEDSPTAATPPDGSDNPLANLLAWPGPSAALSGVSASAPASSGTPGNGKAPSGAVAGLGTETNPATPNAADPTAAASGDGTGTPLPAGMTVLDQPVEADAQTLAALRGAGPNEGEGETKTVQASRADSTPAHPSEALKGASAGKHTAPGTVPQNAPANWRSTAGMGQPSTAQQVHAQFAAQVNAQAHAQAPVETRVATVRSTIALDERFNASTTTTTTAAATASAVNPASHASAGASADGGAGQPGPGGDTSSPAPVDKPTSETDTASALDLRTGDDPAVDGGTWNTHGLRHASLRVGEKGEEAIDIRLSLAGDALNVDFRTDQADIRASLQQHAGDSLSDLLQRSGIQLGDVSVGAQHPGQDQGQNPSGQPPAPDVRGTPASRTDATGSATQDMPRAPARPRSDGSRPVDLFV